MGQYYNIINIDKQEYLFPLSYGNGLKLMEFCYTETNVTRAFENLLGGRWKGDRVYVVGDYADEIYGECWDMAYENLMCKFKDVFDEKCNTPYDLHHKFTEIKDADTKFNGYRYLYNHSLKEYIDIFKCIPIDKYYDEKEQRMCYWKIHPLVLLLTMGNQRGGGDYYGYSEDLVGSWCNTSGYIEITKELLPDCEDYKLIRPIFIEKR